MQVFLSKKWILLTILVVITIVSLAVYLMLFFSDSIHKPLLNINDEITLEKSQQKNSALNTLRVLTWSGAQTYLPRSGHPQDLELIYLKEFAELHQLQFKNIKVNKFSDLIPKLLAGEGDVISANLTVTAQRKKRVNFSDPFIQTNEYLLMGKNSKALKNGHALNGREVILQKGKSYEISAFFLQKTYPKLKIRYIDNNISNELIYDGLASGEYDLTIQDNNLIQSALDYRDDLKKSLQASVKHDIAWAVSPDNKHLLKQLNIFLKTQTLTVKGKSSIKSQWKNIKRTKTVRFVLRNNLSSYYIWRGELLGFHYELAKRFATEHKLRYEIIVAPDNISLIDYIIEDKADIALGFLTPTDERKAKGISFSRPYHYASELLIAHRSFPEISSPSELGKGEVHIRPSSSYWQTALTLQQQATELELIAAPEEQETESIIAYVGQEKYQFTIADSHIVDIEMTFSDDIHSLMSIGEPKAQSWAVKSGNNELLGKVDDFIKKHYKGLFYNVIYNKYFKDKRRLKMHYSGFKALKNSGILSPYDDIVKIYAQKYNFDWHLLVAQMHQESRFNPKATSMAGAKGLFQVMPRTAKELGIVDVHIPEQGIKAGIRYMNWVRERMMKNEVQPDQLIWFTLASYNAGAGHVRDAIRLAKQKGWRNDIWFDNVEKAMLLLAQPKYAAKARYGYVRGQEPVTYIREIKRRFDTYENIFKEE
ncbi:transporter substrate-binding domain-containing protein [Psychromonas hadalis]|uniref:transporter substrate-binding domain-containing protein n=1 Tax=Psychromonas hadalis TaxID=211669 RepID=UPI0003B4F7FF|nr:transporter substrate-binding domain-containing protein [Psychromonas hadalis]